MSRRQLPGQIVFTASYMGEGGREHGLSRKISMRPSGLDRELCKTSPLAVFRLDHALPRRRIFNYDGLSLKG